MAGRDQIKAFHQYIQPKKATQSTLWQRKMEDCEEWYNWFLGRGIPVGIIKRKWRGLDLFAVFRNWKGNRNLDISKAPSLSVIKSGNGFTVNK